MKKLGSFITILLMTLAIGCVTAMAAEPEDTRDITFVIIDEAGNPVEGICVDAMFIPDINEEDQDGEYDLPATDENGMASLNLIEGKRYVLYPHDKAGYYFSPIYQTVRVGEGPDTFYFVRVLDDSSDYYWLMILYVIDRDTGEPLRNFPVFVDGVEYSTDNDGFFVGTFTDYKEYIVTVPGSDTTRTIDESKYKDNDSAKLRAYYSRFAVDFN